MVAHDREGQAMTLLSQCSRVTAAMLLVTVGFSPSSGQRALSGIYQPLKCPGVTKLSAHVTVHPNGTLWYRGRHAEFTDGYFLFG